MKQVQKRKGHSYKYYLKSTNVHYCPMFMPLLHSTDNFAFFGYEQVLVFIL